MCCEDVIQQKHIKLIFHESESEDDSINIKEDFKEKGKSSNRENKVQGVERNEFLAHLNNTKEEDIEQTTKLIQIPGSMKKLE